MLPRGPAPDAGAAAGPGGELADAELDAGRDAAAYEPELPDNGAAAAPPPGAFPAPRTFPEPGMEARMRKLRK